MVGLSLEDRGHRIRGVGLVLLHFELELHLLGPALVLQFEH